MYIKIIFLALAGGVLLSVIAAVLLGWPVVLAVYLLRLFQ